MVNTEFQKICLIYHSGSISKFLNTKTKQDYEGYHYSVMQKVIKLVLQHYKTFPALFLTC